MGDKGVKLKYRVTEMEGILLQMVFETLPSLGKISSVYELQNKHSDYFDVEILTKDNSIEEGVKTLYKVAFHLMDRTVYGGLVADNTGKIVNVIPPIYNDIRLDDLGVVDAGLGYDARLGYGLRDLYAKDGSPQLLNSRYSTGATYLGDEIVAEYVVNNGLIVGKNGLMRYIKDDEIVFVRDGNVERYAVDDETMRFKVNPDSGQFAQMDFEEENVVVKKIKLI